MRVVVQGLENRYNPLWEGAMTVAPRVGDILWLKNPDSDYTVEQVCWNFRQSRPCLVITVGPPR